MRCKISIKKEKRKMFKDKNNVFINSKYLQKRKLKSQLLTLKVNKNFHKMESVT